MLPFLRSDPLLPVFSPFMLDVLEVVDSPVESQKCVATQNEQELKALAQNYRKWKVQFQKPDTPVLSRSTTVRGVVGLRWGASPPAKWHLNDEEA
jgi:hypothetical protein